MSDTEIVYNKSIDEEFTRSNYATNAKGLTQTEIEQRDRDTYEMMKMYPKINPLWADLIWNYCHRTPKERIREIIDNKEWEKPSQKDYKKGGIYLGGIVEDKEAEVN
jgi:hypothetical protein